MKMIVGLGNPGAKYEDTRHNLGFQVVDALRAQLRDPQEVSLPGAEVFESRRRGEPVALVKPLQFMNRSGAPTVGAARRFRVAPEQILVVYDDLDLETGRLRFRRGGGTGGHRGVEDLRSAFEVAFEDPGFHRLRIGIGRPAPGQPVEEFVLEGFGANELEPIAEAREQAVEACFGWFDQGLRWAMDRFNRRPSTPPAEASGDQEAAREENHGDPERPK